MPPSSPRPSPRTVSSLGSSAVDTVAPAETFSRPRRIGVAYVLRLFAVALAALAVGYAAISVRYAEAFSHANRAAIGDPLRIAPSYEDVQFQASDGVVLRGWFFPASRERAAILVQGRDSTRLGENKGEIARFLLTAGYSVLLFDLRGHGESGGERFSLGQHERKDVAAAVDHLVARGIREERVALIGMSMGAGTVLQSVALKPGVGPVVSDSSFVDARTIVEEIGPTVTGLPAFFHPGMLLAAKLLFGLDADAASPVAVVRAHPARAFLFVQCAEDRTVGVHHALALRAASADPRSELWVAPGCGHVEASTKHPQEYERRVLAFLEAHMR